MSRNPKPKDPHAPKAPRNSYWVYAAERRPILIETSTPKTSLVIIHKRIGLEWSAMTETERLPYKKTGEQNQQRYINDCLQYTHTDHYRKYLKILSKWSKEKKAERHKPKEPTKPANYPRFAPSSYMLYANENRMLFQLMHGAETGQVSISKLMAQAWKDLPFEEKQKYTNRMRVNKAKAKQEMTAYQRDHAQEYERYITERQEWKRLKKIFQAHKNKPIDKSAPKHPLNAFLLFKAKMDIKYQSERPDLSMTDRSKLIGEDWKNLDDEPRREYVEEAMECQNEYKRKKLAYIGSESQLEFQTQLKQWETDYKNKGRKKKSTKKSKSSKKKTKSKRK